jgi:hypothetical protein
MKRVLVWLSLSVVVGIGVSYGVALITRGGKLVEVFGDGSLYIAAVGFTTGVLSRLLSRQFAQADAQAARSDPRQAGVRGSSGQAIPAVSIDRSEPVLLLAALILTIGAAVLFGVSQGQVLAKPNVARTLIAEGDLGPGSLPSKEEPEAIAKLSEQDQRARLTKAMENLRMGLSASQRDERETALRLFLEDLQTEAIKEREGVRRAHMFVGFLFLVGCGIIAAITEYRISA